MSNGMRLAEPVTRPPWRKRWSPLAREITIVLIVKFAALTFLWWAFFSHPMARYMTIDAGQVGAHLTGNSAPKESASADR
ncbi:MAG TPA: hypothetical protein VF420_04635 [Casimicrobiaceae bacterium]